MASTSFTSSKSRKSEQNLNTKKASTSKGIKMEDYSNTDDNYKKLHLYIQPRKISIYAPHFKYGPNRIFPEDDDEEEDNAGNNGDEKEEKTLKMGEDEVKKCDEDEQQKMGTDGIDGTRMIQKNTPDTDFKPGSGPTGK